MAAPSLLPAMVLLLVLAPAEALAAPYFNQSFGPSGIALDVTNPEDRSYRCTVLWDFRWQEAGTPRNEHLEQKIEVPPRFSGRVLTVPARTPVATLGGWRFDVSCD